VTIQSDYHRHEWDLILGAPGLVALVLIQAHPYRQQVAHQKMCAVIAAIEETRSQGSASELIRSVISTERAGQSPLWPTEYPRDLGDIRLWALYACRQVATLLAQKVPDAEAEAYTHWLMRIAQRVVTVPEDGVFQPCDPVGCHRRQRSALEDLAAALDAQSIYDRMRAS